MEYRIRTTVPDSCLIEIPDDFRGQAVSIIVRPASERVDPLKNKIEDTSVYALKGILRGRIEEDLENAKDQYLTEKYIHDDDID